MPKLTFNELLKAKRKLLIKYDPRKSYRKAEIEETLLTINELLNSYQGSICYKTELTNYYKKLYDSQILWPFINAEAKLEPLYIFNDLAFDIDQKNLEILIHDFFKNATNNDTFKIFMSFWQQRKESIYYSKNVDNSSQCAYLPYFRQGIILFNRNMTFMDVLTLVHEFGHLIHFYNNYSTYAYSFLAPLLEISSLFFQMIAAEYYEKISKFKSLSTITQINYLNITLDSAKALENEFKSFDGIKNQAELDKAIKGLINSLTEKELEETLMERICLKEDYNYAVSLAIASNLFMIYLSNPNEAFQLLNKLFNIDLKLSLNGYFNKIQDLGLADETGIKNYMEYMKRKLEKL